jgi:hypothetical protein
LLENILFSLSTFFSYGFKTLASNLKSKLLLPESGWFLVEELALRDLPGSSCLLIFPKENDDPRMKLLT